MREIVASGAPLYTLLEDRIRALHPDLLPHAGALRGVRGDGDRRARPRRAAHATAARRHARAPPTLDGVLDDIARVGAALDRADEAEEFLAGARARHARACTRRSRPPRAPRPRVAVIEWGDPIYAAGHWVPEMVRRAGGVDVARQAR